MILGTPSLLITDDDRAFRETLREVFEPRGFRTLLAGDGEEALHIVRSERVHLLLLDMHMPRLSGLEVIQHLRELELPSPCILLSAGLDDEIVAEAQRADVYSVHSKPIRFAEITGVVHRAMRDTYDWPNDHGASL